MHFKFERIQRRRTRANTIFKQHENVKPEVVDQFAYRFALELTHLYDHVTHFGSEYLINENTPKDVIKFARDWVHSELRLRILFQAGCGGCVVEQVRSGDFNIYALSSGSRYHQTLLTLALTIGSLPLLLVVLEHGGLPRDGQESRLLWNDSFISFGTIKPNTAPSDDGYELFTDDSTDDDGTDSSRFEQDDLDALFTPGEIEHDERV